MKRSCDYACHSPEHKIARRQFIGTMAAGSIAGGLGVFTSSSAAEALKSQQKRVVVFNMHGGLSQLESWDPKPGTDTGGVAANYLAAGEGDTPSSALLAELLEYKVRHWKPGGQH